MTSNDIEKWAEKIQAGDLQSVARAISAIERNSDAGIALLKRLFCVGRRARTVGVTGAPGAGKSTLVEKLASDYCASGLRVGILAVDASSPFTGGALLGDRIRMQRLASKEGIYIRSMASRGHLGGLAFATHDAAIVLEAAGMDVVLIETVGVGQAEIEIASLADTTLLLLVPGLGDDVQRLKAGIMEVADIFVINKADRDGADVVEGEITSLLSLVSRQSGWHCPIVKTVATTGEGVNRLRQAIENFRDFLTQTTVGKNREHEKWRARILGMLRESLLIRAVRPRLEHSLIDELAAQVAERRRDPHSAVEQLMSRVVKG